MPWNRTIDRVHVKSSWFDFLANVADLFHFNRLNVFLGFAVSIEGLDNVISLTFLIQRDVIVHYWSSQLKLMKLSSFHYERANWKLYWNNERRTRDSTGVHWTRTCLRFCLHYTRACLRLGMVRFGHGLGADLQDATTVLIRSIVTYRSEPEQTGKLITIVDTTWYLDE